MAGGLALAMAKLTDNTGQNIKVIEAKSESTYLKASIYDNLKDTTACVNTFQAVITTSNMATLTASPSAVVTVPNIKDKLNVIKYSVGTTNNQTISITSIQLTNYNPGLASGDLLLKTNFRRSSSIIQSLKHIVIPIKFNIDASNNLTFCSSTSSSNGDSSGWKLGGNAETVDGADFIGTIDTSPLNFRVNNIRAGRIDSNGLTYFGYEAGNANISTTQNTAIGTNSLKATSAGNSNTAIGYSAAAANSSGSNNVFIGANAASQFTSGNGNIFLGANSGTGITSSSNKLYIDSTTAASPLLGGDFSTREVTVTGKTVVNSTTAAASINALDVNVDATAIGTTATAIGVNSKLSRGYPFSGTMVGVKSTPWGGNQNIGVWSTLEGADYGIALYASINSTPPAAASTYGNSDDDKVAAVFNGSTIHMSNVYTKGYTTMYKNLVLEVGANPYTKLGGPWGAWSDIRLKKDIHDLDSSLDKITKLRPVHFKWKNPTRVTKAGHESGFIAQEVEKIFPDWVNETEVKDKDLLLIPKGKKAKTITFPMGFYAYLVKAMQELNEKIIGSESAATQLRNKVLNLQNENKLLTERIDRIEKQLLK